VIMANQPDARCFVPWIHFPKAAGSDGPSSTTTNSNSADIYARTLLGDSTSSAGLL